MIEKMTDEDVTRALRVIAGGFPHVADELGAHIAFLAAERDEAWSLRATEARDSAEELRALRERVRAQTTYKEGWRKRAEAAESRLAALEADGSYWKRTASSVDRELQAAHARLAAIRQRAGDIPRLIHAYQEGQGCASVARYIVGNAPEVCAKPSTVEGTHKLGTNSGPDENACGDCGKHVREHRDGGTAERCEARGELTEPTTAEAFETVRQHCRIAARCGATASDAMDVVMDGLSLLECRMGAMKRALETGHRCGRQLCDTCDASINAVLEIDAPPVYTLEEVRTAATTYLHWRPLADLMRDLSALRR